MPAGFLGARGSLCRRKFVSLGPPVRGIYALDGDARPTRFETKEGSGLILAVHERVK
jgi:hypothetical protein